MLGWNIQYGFNDSDFEVSENLLSIYLDEYEETPWDALKYLVSLLVRGQSGLTGLLQVKKLSGGKNVLKIRKLSGNFILSPEETSGKVKL